MNIRRGFILRFKRCLTRLVEWCKWATDVFWQRVQSMPVISLHNFKGCPARVSQCPYFLFKSHTLFRAPCNSKIR